MYNFIIQLLGIEDNNITIDDYFKDKDGKLIIYISYKNSIKNYVESNNIFIYCIFGEFYFNRRKIIWFLTILMYQWLIKI